MRLTKNDDVVQAIPTYGANESFTDRILRRASRCRFDFLDANRLNPLLKLFTVNPVTIAQQIPRFAAVGEGLDHLLAGPACGGMFRYVDMHDASAIMGQNHQDKQDSEGSGGNNEKADGNQVFDMIVQEGAPYLGRTGAGRPAPLPLPELSPAGPLSRTRHLLSVRNRGYFRILPRPSTPS